MIIFWLITLRLSRHFKAIEMYDIAIKLNTALYQTFKNKS